MSRYHSYLNSSARILSQYEGREPFASFLKKYFAAEKKYGSKDRKAIAHLCYCAFRLGRAAESLSAEEKIIKGLFICTDQEDPLLNAIDPVLGGKVHLSYAEKLTIAGLDLQAVFPWKDELSEGIDHNKFCSSFFIQPDLFLRIRPGHLENVLNKLEAGGISFELIGDSTVRLPNNSKLDNIFEMDKEAVVQDLDSQRVGELFPADGVSTIWDCCAASGGKSIMAYDKYSSIDLTVSDIRESILVNLRKRFQQAGIRKYKSFVSDLSGSFSPSRDKQYDLVIADLPCTGSGTWSRTPEQLCYFDPKKIDEYADLQKKICANLVSSIKQNGYLLYITCSVFKKENEEVLAFLKNKFHLGIARMELLRGYSLKADTLFAALLKRRG